MVELFHMSETRYGPGDTIKGNGRDKVDEVIEAAFAAARPQNSLCRRKAVYCRAVTDFSMCGVDRGYIYKVASKTKPEVHDLSWLKDLELALIKQMYIEKYPVRISDYPDLTDDLLTRCANGYWSGKNTDDVTLEYLVPEATIVEVLSDVIVEAAATVDGWRP